MAGGENSGEISLGGDWLIRPDPEDAGLGLGWWRPRVAGEGWVGTVVPGAWQKTLGQDCRGVAWYRKSVEVPRAWRRAPARMMLRFESVATDCRVWVNGIEVGRHIGDYLPFEFDITRALAETAEIVCRVDQVHAPPPEPGVLVQNGHITKGFHDVLSLQHAGIWGPVTLRRTGPATIVPDGIRVIADPASGVVSVRVEFDGDPSGCVLEARVTGPEGEPVAHSAGRWQRRTWEGGTWEGEVHVPRARAWSPESPVLYALSVEVAWGSGERRIVESRTVRFGFRAVTVGGPRNRNILLNGEPLLLRGVLHWGHEPEHIAPAPPPEQVRAEFARLREMGFNCICLCMWYPPRHYYEIADETGMLLWQEHPVWKSRMEEELIGEYRRLYEGFFRRDRNHPSVVIVSGSCEHERFHPELAAWWWERAKQEMPDRLAQVQTAFIGWVNPDQTDLHDEHVYDNSGRWACFLRDVQEALAELGPPKPFVMGETIIGTSWLDTGAVRAAVSSHARPHGAEPWWKPEELEECEAFERWLTGRFGGDAVARFRDAADGHNLRMRRFQSELFRMHPNHAGWVMNQIRDVARGRMGFMDDLGRWRFSPRQTLPWLADAALLLWTPDHRRGFCGGGEIACRIGVSNFRRGGRAFEGPVELSLEGAAEGRIESGPLRCEAGDVQSAPFALALPGVESPTALRIRAAAAGLPENAWDLWVLPRVDEAPPGVARLDGLAYSAREARPPFEERAYSSGWGLGVRSWRAVLPDPSLVLFKAPLFRFDAPVPRGTRVVLTHTLTRRLVEFMQGGGGVVLLASPARGGLGADPVVLWGQTPLVVEGMALAPGDARWVEELLHHDLSRRWARAIPVEGLGIADSVDPVVRLVFTHDSGRPRLMDAVFAARVGGGVLIATSLDHTEDAGRFVLERLLEFLLGTPSPAGELDPGRLAALAAL